MAASDVIKKSSTKALGLFLLLCFGLPGSLQSESELFADSFAYFGQRIIPDESSTSAKLDEGLPNLNKVPLPNLNKVPLPNLNKVPLPNLNKVPLPNLNKVPHTSHHTPALSSDTVTKTKAIINVRKKDIRNNVHAISKEKKTTTSVTSGNDTGANKTSRHGTSRYKTSAVNTKVVSTSKPETVVFSDWTSSSVREKEATTNKGKYIDYKDERIEPRTELYLQNKSSINKKDLLKLYDKKLRPLFKQSKRKGKRKVNKLNRNGKVLGSQAKKTKPSKRIKKRLIKKSLLNLHAGKRQSLNKRRKKFVFDPSQNKLEELSELIYRKNFGKVSQFILKQEEGSLRATGTSEEDPTTYYYNQDYLTLPIHKLFGPPYDHYRNRQYFPPLSPKATQDEPQTSSYALPPPKHMMDTQNDVTHLDNTPPSTSVAPTQNFQASSPSKNKSANIDLTHTFNTETDSLPFVIIPVNNQPRTSTPLPTTKPPLTINTRGQQSPFLNAFSPSIFVHRTSSLSNSTTSEVLSDRDTPNKTNFSPNVDSEIVESKHQTDNGKAIHGNTKFSRPQKKDVDDTKIKKRENSPSRKSYPTYERVPLTSFTCLGRSPGMYADFEAKCQVWHTCDTESRKYSFLCPNGTIFNQRLLTCDWWYNNAECNPIEPLPVHNGVEDYEDVGNNFNDFNFRDVENLNNVNNFRDVESNFNDVNSFRDAENNFRDFDNNFNNINTYPDGRTNFQASNPTDQRDFQASTPRQKRLNRLKLLTDNTKSLRPFGVTKPLVNPVVQSISSNYLITPYQADLPPKSEVQFITGRVS